MEGSFSLEKDLFKKWKEEKKVQTTFDSNGFTVFLDGKLNPNKEAQQFIIDMLQIYMTDYYGEFYPKKKKNISGLLNKSLFIKSMLNKFF